MLATPFVLILDGAIPPLRALATNLQPAEQVCLERSM